jgi:hypothetical protein
VIGRDLRIAIEETFANSKNMDAQIKDEDQADAEDDAQGQDRVVMRVDDSHAGKIPYVELSVSHGESESGGESSGWNQPLS